MSKSFWCEARCDGLMDDDVEDCYETSDGAFGMINAKKAAKSGGWKSVGGKWFCPSCFSRKHEQ